MAWISPCGTPICDLLREAKNTADTFNRQVESVLTPAQQHEWREIRSELRNRAKERA